MNKEQTLATGRDTLIFSPGTLLVFVDETGDEVYSDRRYPIFGRGGCIVMGSEYNVRVVRPWNRLLDELGWDRRRPFHAAEFVKMRPSPAEIEAINRFAHNGFFRFGITTHVATMRPADVDGHQVVSMAVGDLIRKLVSSRIPSSVALIFENSERSNKLVERDFRLENLQMSDLFGRDVPVEGLFLEKSSRAPGLELADLIAHTAGGQQRHVLVNKSGFRLDFKELFQRVAGDELAYYWSIETVQRIEAAD